MICVAVAFSRWVGSAPLSMHLAIDKDKNKTTIEIEIEIEAVACIMCSITSLIVTKYRPEAPTSGWRGTRTTHPWFPFKMTGLQKVRQPGRRRTRPTDIQGSCIQRPLFVGPPGSTCAGLLEPVCCFPPATTWKSDALEEECLSV